MKFSIRDVLWLMVVVGVTLAWWTARNETQRAKRQAESLRSDLQRLSDGLHQEGLAWGFGSKGVFWLKPVAEGKPPIKVEIPKEGEDPFN